MHYNPYNWYWNVGQSTTQVYASARSTYVPLTDATYLAWVGAGNTARAIDSEASLMSVLARYDVPFGLQGYANAKQWRIATGGYTVTIGGAAIVFATDAQSLSLMTGQVVDFQQVTGAPASVAWQTGPTTFVTIAAADFVAAAAEINAFVRATFVALSSVMAAIAAGSITTAAQVDAAAWPSTISSTAI